MIGSMIIFFVFFLLVGTYLLIMGKSHVAYMEKLPLNDEND
jgi:hypothetical protein